MSFMSPEQLTGQSGAETAQLTFAGDADPSRICPAKALHNTLYMLASNPLGGPGSATVLKTLPSIECDQACPGPEDKPLHIGRLTLPLLSRKVCTMPEGQK